MTIFYQWKNAPLYERLAVYDNYVNYILSHGGHSYDSFETFDIFWKYHSFHYVVNKYKR